MGGEPIWFCSSCGDGPRGIWQTECTSCSHPRCDSCRVEFDSGPSGFFGEYGELQTHRSQSYRSTISPKQTFNAAQSGSKGAVRSSESVKSSSKVGSVSLDEETKDGQKNLHNHPRINLRNAPEVRFGNQRDHLQPRYRRPSFLRDPLPCRTRETSAPRNTSPSSNPPPRRTPETSAPRDRHDRLGALDDLLLFTGVNLNQPDVAQRASEQVSNTETDNDSKMEVERHKEYNMIEPDPDTAGGKPSLSHLESQSDSIPISLHGTGSSQNTSHGAYTPDLGIDSSKHPGSSSHMESSSPNLFVDTTQEVVTPTQDTPDEVVTTPTSTLRDGSPDASKNPGKNYKDLFTNYGAPERIEEPAVEQNHAIISAAEDRWTSSMGWGLDIDFPKTIPGSPSYASSVASISSVGSLASSATDLSRSSGYSAVQIVSATKVLLSVFQEDDSLLAFCKNAMDNPQIGPDRLRRNLRRIFNVYSKQLECEAKERLGFLTSRLVRMKSGLLATSIVEKLQTPQLVYLVSHDEHRDESSDEDGDESSEAYPVNEEDFEDLDVFREFLVKSDAFQNLHTQVQAFVMSKPTQTAHTSTIETENPPAKDAVQRCLPTSATQAKRSLTWESWTEDIAQTIDGMLRDTSIKTTANAMMFLFTDAFMLATDSILIVLGQLEPALKPGMTRLRWRCNCGDRLYSDILELRAGGISELTGHMQQTSRTKVHVSSYNQQNSSQQYIVPRPFQWIQNAWKKIRVTLGRPIQLPASLPQHNTQCHSNASSAPNNQPRQDILHLLACIHRNRVRICLKQDRIDSIETDRTLLCFLRRQYMYHRGSVLRMISPKRITGLWFVKFWLPIGGSVSIRHHERCCVTTSSASKMCECIPPAAKVEPSPGAEYRCVPGPPATYPPIPPEYLSSLITCPTDVHEKDTWIWDQLPKRTCGQLQGQIGKPAEGWGIYYQEGWDHDIIAFVILVVLVVASLIFGILWSRYHFDIQGAFGVSAYLMAVCAVLLHVVANQAGKRG